MWFVNNLAYIYRDFYILYIIMSNKIIVNIWDRFGDRTYIWWDKKKWKLRYIYCKCKCWKEKRIQLSVLTKWRSTHCLSCWLKWINKKHWMYWTRFYNIYLNIKARCKDKKNIWYWNKWVQCERKTFEEFKNDMYESYIKHINKYWEMNTTIDRIDSNKNYNKENCKWSTCKEQSDNRSYTLLEKIRTYYQRHKNNFFEYMENRRKLKS